MDSLKLLGGRVAINVLARDVQNAKEIQEAAEGYALIGVTAKGFDTIDQAVKVVRSFQESGCRVSIGLGDGDASQWEKVVQIAQQVNPEHINQVFPLAAYTQGYLSAIGLNPLVNALVSPSGTPGIVRVSTGPLSEQAVDALIYADTALYMLREAGIRSVKVFPVQGDRRLDEVAAVARAAARVGIDVLEPTGGINEGNLERVLEVALESGVSVVIPHVYSAIVDKETGLTSPSAVANLLRISRKVLARM